VSAVTHDQRPLHRPPLAQRVARVGALGGALGLIAGLVELSAGPMVREWVGSKQDTTRLGIATVVLATIALASASALVHRPTAKPPRRFALALGLLLPGLICFTTVGRLWYIPGVLLVASGAVAAAGTWRERRAIAEAAERSWTAMLVVFLALLYIFLGATALGLAGVAGIAGGLAILALVALRSNVPGPLALVLLLIATLPFAMLTWWSAAVPLTGLLLLAFGAPVLARHRRPGREPERPSRRQAGVRGRATGRGSDIRDEKPGVPTVSPGSARR
jgi:hypothetical protein